MSFNRPITPVTPSLSSTQAEKFVFHVTLFILSAAGLFVLLRLPRAFARFWRFSEWIKGHMFWHIPYRHSRAQRRVYANNSINGSSSETCSTSETKDAASDDSHTLYVHNNNNTSQHQVQTTFDLPPHIATCPAFLQRLVLLHRVRLSPGFSVSQAAIMICYFLTLLYAGLYKSSPFSDPVRAGWVAVSQLPIVIALATKNNILGSLMGFTYEKLNYLHRFLGQLIVLAANVHSLGYFYKWSIGGTFQQSIRNPSTIWGLVGLVALDCMFFFSQSFWRHRFHNIMLPVHVTGLAIAIPAIWKHKPYTMRWMCACIGIYAFDRVCRIIKTRISTANIRLLPELSCTRVEVPHINGGWRAGQHVRLRVLSSAMGWFTWTEAHPFTIASVADGEEGIVLLVKKSGKWTERLYDMAKGGEFSEAGRGCRVKVLVEGPYGGPCHAIFASYSAAVFIVGGSGITFALSAMQGLIRDDLAGRSRVKSITLIWSIQDPSSLNPLLPRLMSMIQESVYTPIHISVHYTRAYPGGAKPRAPVAHPRIMLSSGRPQILRSLEAALARAVSLVEDPRDESRVSGMLVGVCGPVGLGDDVTKAVATIEPARRDQVGGIEIHE
ncbi:hypothetical protein C0992_009146, partial [Termitomyces sp. T32_za158]